MRSKGTRPHQPLDDVSKAIISQLQQARAANDARNVSLLVAQLTLLLVRLRN